LARWIDVTASEDVRCARFHVSHGRLHVCASNLRRVDPLTDLLNGVRARSTAFCQALLDPPWSLRIADGAALALVTTLRGHAWVVPDDGDPVAVAPGDVAIVKGPRHYTVSDDPGTAPQITVLEDNRLLSADGTDVTTDLLLGPRTSGTPGGSTIVASGTYQVSNDVTGRLLAALPHVVLVPEAATNQPVMALLAHEVGYDGPGQQVVLDRLLDIALVSTLRAWFALQEDEAPGWFRAQHDPLVGPTLTLMHADPSHPWTVEDLAAAAGCSRATYARRFASVVGETPMAYLAGWRIALAADLLRAPELTLEAVARRVGYANPFAFSVAFKRIRGQSPAHFRAGRATGPQTASPAS
jgi:AraC-like DNA-binding protein